MGIKIKDLLALLQTPEVREEIRKICREDSVHSEMKMADDAGCTKNHDSADSQGNSLQTEADQLKQRNRLKEAELEQLKGKLQMCSRELDKLRVVFDQKEKANASLKEELRQSEQQVLALQNRLAQVEDSKAELELRFFREQEALKRKLGSERDELAGKLDRTMEELKKLTLQYEGPEKCFHLYKQLSESTKDGLSNVICEQDLIHFVSSLSNQDSIRRVWEYAKSLLSDGNTSDVEILKEIFFYFFELYNSSLAEPVFSLDDTLVGDEYEDAWHAKARGSASSGVIREVILPGYRSINTGKPICKTVVFV